MLTLTYYTNIIHKTTKLQAPTPAATETCSAPATTLSCTTNPNQFCKLPTNSCTVGTGVCSDKPQTCTANVAFVCGCNGVTYTNECLAWFAGTSVFSEGKCETNSPTVSPTEVVVTNSPTVSPSDKPVTNEPTTSEPTNKPSVSPVTDAPSPNPVTDSPTKAPQVSYEKWISGLLFEKKLNGILDSIS